jgi:hypothetical protein
MVKKGNLVAILVVVIVILGAMFLMTYSGEIKQVIHGLASLPAGPCPCVGDVKPGSCSLSTLPWYCEQDGPDTCRMIDNCAVCGCDPDKECQDDGRCMYPGYGDDNDSGSDEKTCENHNDCGLGKVCLILDDVTEGTCQSSEDGDGICAYSGLEDHFEYDESCFTTNGFVDCEGKRADCPGELDICVELFNGAGYGYCEISEEYICYDGTLPGSCSDNYPGYYCDYINDTLELYPDCSGGDDILGNGNDCSCDTEAGPDGDILTCIFDDLLFPEYPWQCQGNVEDKPLICGDDFCDPVSEDCESCPLDCCPLDSPPVEGEEVSNYCTYVGGSCEKDCSSGYFPLDETDYFDLVQDCKNEDSSYQCCYPYENDEVNDCEYYGGSCLSECGDNSYYADVEYLDGECEFYTGDNSICCIPYIQGDEEYTEDLETGDNWLDSLFGEGDGSDENSGAIKLSENVSLNREKVIIGLILLIIGVGGVVVLLPKLTKKK